MTRSPNLRPPQYRCEFIVRCSIILSQCAIIAVLAGCTIFDGPAEDALPLSREAKAWFAEKRPFPNLADVPGSPGGPDTAVSAAEMRSEPLPERDRSPFVPEPLLRLLYPPGALVPSDRQKAGLAALAPAAHRLRVVGLGDDGYMKGRAARVAQELRRSGYAGRIEEVTAPGPNAVEIYAE